MEVDDALEEIYYNPRHPASFGGVEKLYAAAKEQEPAVTRKAVKEWLKGQEAYTLHRKAAQRYGRRQTTVRHEGQQL